jgi:hypothetical protein
MPIAVIKARNAAVRGGCITMGAGSQEPRGNNDPTFNLLRRRFADFELGSDE